MSSVWFSSDHHFGHARVIEYSKRPFDDANEMDEAMIANWNSVVRPGDRVYHLGDFSFHKPEKTLKILNRLQGQKFLVFGNHDKHHRKDESFLGHWVWAKDLADITVGSQRIVLCHYAMMTWNQSHRGAYQLHGHSHGSLKPDKHALRADVGVDCWNYYPVSFDEIVKHMSKKDYQPVDHHGRKDDGQGD